MPLVIGTAGHIDHGKTALVRALTGQDTDRLPEERARGISIDLGFARWVGPDGVEAGVVDVPGHERFVRTMVAGAHGIDLVLFVVAADDGVMPQSIEHLDIVHVLGVRRGIFVITKTDLVDAARVAAVREDIGVLAAGTVLDGAPVVAVSAATGAGLAELNAAIAAALAGVAGRSAGGPFRLPVDRSFVLRGHGLVVTGTAIAGEVAEGESLRALPGGRIVRVRSVEVHGQRVARARAGQRVALNIGGAERGEIARGDVLAAPALDRATARFDAWVELRPGAPLRIETHGRVRLHAGTAETLAKVVLLGGRGRLEPGEAAFAQLVLRRPVATLGGDRFVLRDQTARWTLGGGVVLAPFADRHRVGDPEVLDALDTLRTGGPAGVPALLRLSERFGETAEALALAGGLAPEAARAALAAAGAQAVPDGTDELWVPRDRWERFEQAVLASVADVHARQPALPGASLEQVRSRLPWAVPPRAFRWGVERLVQAGRLVRDGDLLRDPAHRLGLDAAAAALAARIEPALAAAGLTPPSVPVLAAELGEPAPRVREVAEQLARAGRAVRVAPDLYFHPDAVAAGQRAIAEHCQAHGEITAAQFRDRIGASRKFAIAFLDWCDRTGFTTRVGDVRRLRR